jgi:hypothetical protein
MINLRFVITLTYLFSLIFSLAALIKSNISLANDQVTPFVYQLNHGANFYKKLTVDELGMVVVTLDKSKSTDPFEFTRIVLYSLDHSRTLKWVIEDSNDVPQILDSVVTNEAVYILHEVFDSPDRRALSKFSRKEGSFIWRRVIVGSKNATHQYLQVNESINSITLAGVVDDMTHLWWYGIDGLLTQHWFEDLEPDLGSSDNGEELLFDLKLMSDNSVVIGSILINGAGSVQLTRVNQQGETVFMYNEPADVIIGSHNIDKFSLLKTSQDHFFISYEEEDVMGIPRLNQIYLNDKGTELFNNNYADLALYSEKNSDNLKPGKNEVISLAQLSAGLSQNNELKIINLNLNLNGIIESSTEYSFDTQGGIGNIQQSSLNNKNNLFVIASIRNPWPNQLSDTLYLKFNSNLELCSEQRVTGTDFYTQLHPYAEDYFELRVIESEESNALHVLKHSNVFCELDEIFVSGFESQLIQ